MRNHYGKTRNSCRAFVLLFMLSAFSVKALAVDEPREVTLKGTTLLTYPINTAITNADPIFGTGGWSGQQALGVQNIVQFEIDFNNTANIFFHNLTFTTTCTVDIKCYGNPSSPGTITQSYNDIPLQVNYNPAAGAAFKGIAEYKFNGAYRVDVFIKSITATGLSPLTSYPIFSLTNKMIVSRQYNFNDNTSDIINYTTDGKKLNLSWVPTNYAGAESFDLEWTYVDELSTPGALIKLARLLGQTTISQALLESFFRNNSSRVNIPGYQYQFNLNYNKGFILFRIRGVQFRSSDGLRLEGNWNYQADALSGSVYAHFDQGIVDADWHEQDLNWQYNAVYAEDGKKKEVINYFDGAGRSRQTVTLNNEDNVSVVAEPVYDALGRPSMSILPAPVSDNKLQYYRSFNVNNSLAPVSYKDIPSANCGIIASPLSSSSGVEKYYSASNPFMADANKPWNKAIPQSEGFPFSVTQYTPDNTGRIRAQSGVGKDFKLGSGHETKYYYGKPSQYELDRLFGAEAGEHTKYLKNMVQDANGQVSVSYQNSEGKTVATALAGLPPIDKVEALPSSTAPTTTVKDIMLTPSSFQINNARSSLEATNTFLVSSTGNYKFTYRFLPEQYQENFSGGTLCYTCTYDLLITLKDECGNELQRVDIKNINPSNTACINPTEVSNFFEVPINTIGEYTAYFELLVSKETLDTYTEHYLQNNTDIKKLNYFLLEQLIEENLAECYNDCEACKTLPETEAEFIEKIRAYYTKEGLPFGTPESNYAAQLYNTIKSNCLTISSQCVPSPCAEILDVIKSDVTPGGQYADFDNDYTLIDPEINVLRYYSQLQYVDENGQPATVENDNGDLVSPQQLSLKEFILKFEDSWAIALAPYHPEYCYYTWCTMNGASQVFNQKLEDLNDPTDAIAAGYFNRNNILALLQNDPFFTTGYGLPYVTNMQNDLNAYSVNVLNITTQSSKDILKTIDFLLYCGNQDPFIGWDDCNKSVTDPCRSDFKEWLLYKEWYLDLKLKYYTLAMKQALPQCNNCYIPSSGGGDPGGWTNCIAPPASDFSVSVVPNSSADGIKRIIVKYRDGNETTNWPISVTVQMSGPGGLSLTQEIIFTPGFGSQEMMVQDEFDSFMIIAVSCAELTGKKPSMQKSVGQQKSDDGKNQPESIVKGGLCPDQSSFTWSLVPAAQGKQLEVCYIGPAIPVGTIILVNGTIDLSAAGLGQANVQFEFCSNTPSCVIASPYVADNLLPQGSVNFFFNSITCEPFECSIIQPCLSSGITINYETGEVCANPNTTFQVSFDAITNCGLMTYTMNYGGSGNCIVFPNWNAFCTIYAVTNLSITQCEGGGWVCPDQGNFSVSGVGTSSITACLNNSLIPLGHSVTLTVEVAYRTSPSGPTLVRTEEITFCYTDRQPTSYCITRDLGVWQIDAITILGVKCDIYNCGGSWECPITDANYNVQQGYNAGTQTWDITICYTGPAIPANKTVTMNVTATNANCAPYSVNFTAAFCQSQNCFTYKIPGPWLCETNWGISFTVTCLDKSCNGSCPEKTEFTAAMGEGIGLCQLTFPGLQAASIRVTHTGGPLAINAPVQRVKVKVEITTFNSSTNTYFKRYRYVWFTNGESTKDICYYYPANRTITGISIVSTECKGACSGGDCCDDPRYSLYDGKIRRFQDYVGPDFNAIQNSYYSNPVNTAAYPMATCKNECEAMADGWILDLKNCTTDLQKLERVRRQLIDVCKQSCVAQQGNATIHPYSDVNPLPSFESVIIAEFGSLTPDCAYDLISDPYPWGKAPVMEKIFATEASAQVCTRLQQLINEAQSKGYTTNVAGVHQYLKDYYSPYYDLEDDELQQLFTGCQECNGIMPLPVELPPFMNGDAKDCLPCTVYEQKKAQFLAKYPGITAAHPKYDMLFRNYMNHQTGFSHAFASYYDFELKCLANQNNFRQFGRICETPLQMEMDVNTINQCIDEKFYNALANATVIYTRYIEEVKRVFRNNYTAKCLSVKPSLESEAKLYEYHYTLYYYDQSGNLVKTVPPKGVAYLTGTEINTLWTDRNQFIVPPHTLATTYQYNSFNLLVKQFSPDGGTSEFWYDRLGRLAVSQNEEQKTPANGGAANRYSYTKYEPVLGRITEVGEKTGAASITSIDTRNDSQLQTWLAGGTDAQITTTIYDKADITQVTNTAITNEQQFYTSRKRVVATMFRKIRYASPSQYDAATHYSYDITGNAKTVWQENTRLKEADAATQGLKRMDYEFDLVSGKVNKAWYQKNKGDQFIYEYKYDAENRVIAARSSRDGLVWQNDASYKYYLHGPLARTELGSLKVQGTDYAYTLQGWTKHINAPVLNEKVDIGHDGDPTLSGNIFAGVARDALGYSISYFNGEYKPIAPGSLLAFAESIPASNGTGKNLFNGNIRATTLQIAQLGSAKTYSYSYDQLNRIVKMRKHETSYSDGGSTGGPTLSIGTPTSEYQEDITYDPNGNILSYLRNGTAAQPAMDNLNYNYIANKNQLEYVQDGVTATNYTEDIDNQAAGNYSYDKIGNLVKDTKENITNIEWTVYGKISKITKNDAGATIIEYEYDAGGNRIYKKVSTGGTVKYTWYMRDASGNTMAIYTRADVAAVQWAEQHLYGSSRLGMVNLNIPVPSSSSVPAAGAALADGFEYGRIVYELSNHLGNVLVTVSDKKLQVQNGSTGTVLYHTADVVTATDYYPFGMVMPGRKYEPTSGYRYGFNGKEKDNEVKGENNQLDFGNRVYDPRLGHWLSVDPEAKRYPGYSPYNYALNTPISAVDPDGRLIIFIGGLRLWVGQGDQKGDGYKTSNSYQGIYNYDIYNYWSDDKNSFGRKADIAGGFKNRLGDNNAWYTSGSSTWRSQPKKRIEQGKKKAEEFHAMVQSGQIKLEKDETIKIVSHSQGGAHSVGFAQQLMSYKNKDGTPMYKVEVMYYITPHQPNKFSHVAGVKGVQYSHPLDAVSSDDPFWLPNGGSKFAMLEGITEFDGRDLMYHSNWLTIKEPGQVECTGASGNRGGHNVEDNDFIFDILKGDQGYIEPRKDTPKDAGTKVGEAAKKPSG